MKGISFVVDAHNNKKAVMIDLSEYGELWEDFYDSLLAFQRKDEARESIESVKQNLHIA
jgi:PHD/YefM family antitoxin component YafN of YafNO toxin-antitoxin module